MMSAIATATATSKSAPRCSSRWSSSSLKNGAVENGDQLETEERLDAWQDHARLLVRAMRLIRQFLCYDGIAVGCPGAAMLEPAPARPC